MRVVPLDPVLGPPARLGDFVGRLLGLLAPDEILRRLEHAGDRPLLDVADPRSEIERLLSLRHQAYATIPWQVDTTRLSPAKVVERVCQFACQSVRAGTGGEADKLVSRLRQNPQG